MFFFLLRPLWVGGSANRDGSGLLCVLLCLCFWDVVSHLDAHWRRFFPFAQTTGFWGMAVLACRSGSPPIGGVFCVGTPPIGLFFPEPVLAVFFLSARPTAVCLRSSPAARTVLVCACFGAPLLSRQQLGPPHVSWFSVTAPSASPIPAAFRNSRFLMVGPPPLSAASSPAAHFVCVPLSGSLIVFCDGAEVGGGARAAPHGGGGCWGGFVRPARHGCGPRVPPQTSLFSCVGFFGRPPPPLFCLPFDFGNCPSATHRSLCHLWGPTRCGVAVARSCLSV